MIHYSSPSEAFIILSVGVFPLLVLAGIADIFAIAGIFPSPSVEADEADDSNGKLG